MAIKPMAQARPQTAAYFVYIVRCADRTLYTGVARDLICRLAAHNAGQGARYTAGRRPVRLVYSERQPSRSLAQQREWIIKKLTRQEKQALIRQRGSGAPQKRRQDFRPGRPAKKE